MKTHDFWYDLPEELIAQTPLEKRDTSRLLVMDRVTGEVKHQHFYDIIDYLQPGDMIGLNASSATTYHLYLGKTTEGETTTYWFATSTAAKVGYTADQVSSVLPADTNYFVVARFCNFYDQSN